MSDHPEHLPDEGPFESLDPRVEAELAEALRAAYAPAPLSVERHRQILEMALEDPLAPPSVEELAESERLRAALDTGDARHPDVALAALLKSAVAPAPLEGTAAARAREKIAPRAAPGRVIFVTFGALALAAAAGFALSIARPRPEAARMAQAPVRARATPLTALAQSRSTGALFDAPFEAGKTTSRIDRIALARAQELRENRYLGWGVR